MGALPAGPSRILFHRRLRPQGTAEDAGGSATPELTPRPLSADSRRTPAPRDAPRPGGSGTTPLYPTGRGGATARPAGKSRGARERARPAVREERRQLSSCGRGRPDPGSRGEGRPSPRERSLLLRFGKAAKNPPGRAPRQRRVLARPGGSCAPRSPRRLREHAAQPGPLPVPPPPLPPIAPGPAAPPERGAGQRRRGRAGPRQVTAAAREAAQPRGSGASIYSARPVSPKSPCGRRATRDPPPVPRRTEMRSGASGSTSSKPAAAELVHRHIHPSIIARTLLPHSQQLFL